MQQDTSITTAPSEKLSRTFPCKQCGASLRFTPGMQKLRCNNCSTENDVPSFDQTQIAAAVTELDYRQALAQLAEKNEQITTNTVTCPGCGAQTSFKANVVADKCAFCATPIVAANAQAKRLIKPTAVVPFQMEQRAAQTQFGTWLGSRWFAPSALKANARSTEGMRGVYLPYWTFDADTYTDYVGERGVNRTETETRTSAQGQTENVSRTITDWYHASGQVNVRFDDELIVGSHTIPDEMAGVLQDWDLRKLMPYTDDYVAGFTVEAYAQGLEDSFEIAQKQFQGRISSAVRQDIGGDQQRIHQQQTQYGDISFKHILLPVWISSYRFNDKAYRVVINGQTGQVLGDRPYSAWKIAFTVLGVLIALWLLSVIFGR